MKTYTQEEIDQFFLDQINPEFWTVIIPAAGKGTRLGYDKPKILYPIAGRTILDRMIDLLEPRFSQFVLALSPAGAPDVIPELEKRIPGRFETVTLQSRGMADSIYQALHKVTTPYVLIIWGDQVAISDRTIVAVQKILQFTPGAKLAFPVVKREQPYVHYEVDEHGSFTHVLERREGANMPPQGRSDCGVFAFETRRLREVYDDEVQGGITLSRGTKEWNFLPMLPHFEAGGTSVNVYQLDVVEETIGVNDVSDALMLEKHFNLSQRPMKERQEKVKVAMFSGGRGTGAITDALLRYPDIELTLLVNTYDDGLSTGLLRRFIPGMLGPSDVRKNISRFLHHKKDRASQALLFLVEYRFPDPYETTAALTLLRAFSDLENIEYAKHEILQARDNLALNQIKMVAAYLEAFLRYYEAHPENHSWFPFGDVSLGNLLFAGCYLESGQDFNQAVSNFSRLAEIGDRVLNLTNGENRVLVALKENGLYLHDEASVVGPQDTSRIEEIFLLPRYLKSGELSDAMTKSEKIAYLRSVETLPSLSDAARQVLLEADIIIYGPGTQYSSLLPSYLTLGVAEAIERNAKAEKVFIANIARDYDILGEDATTLTRAFLWNMSRKGQYPAVCRKFISRFFFQKPETTASGETPYVPFNAAEFEYPLDKVRWIDWEGDKGKHLGAKTISELLILVEGEMEKRVHHVAHRVSIVVPVLDEVRTVGQVLKNLRALDLSPMKLDKEIIVVDGGSTDGTLDLLAQESDIRIYSAPGGRGKALGTGIIKAKGDIVVFFPSDGEYNEEDILRVVAPLVNQEFPVVLGSRAFRTHDLNRTLKRVYGSHGILFFVSKYGGIALSILMLVIYHRFISDPFTTLRGFNMRVFRGMRFEHRGAEFDMELLAKIIRLGHVILEVPVSYQARTVAEGKKTTVWDGLRYLQTLLRYTFWKPKQ